MLKAIFIYMQRQLNHIQKKANQHQYMYMRLVDDLKIQSQSLITSCKSCKEKHLMYITKIVIKSGIHLSITYY